MDWLLPAVQLESERQDDAEMRTSDLMTLVATLDDCAPRPDVRRQQ